MRDGRPDGPAAAEGPTVDDRRRVISLALTRRSQLDLDELHVTLERLGIDVDTETLVADLDALGYDIDDSRGDDSVGDDVRADASDAEAGADVTDAALVDAVRAQGGRPVERHVAVTVAVAAVLLIVVAAVVIFGGGDDEGGTATPRQGGAASSAAAGGGAAAGGATTVPVRTAPAGPGSDPALTAPDLTFDFAADSAELPAPADGTAWEALGGDFEVVGGSAVSSLPGEAGALVGLTGPTPDARIQVTLPEPSEASGLAFRIGDGGSDYYAWVAAPAYATVNLYRVTPLGREVVYNSGITAVGAGMTLGVNLTGTTAELLANGAVVGSVPDVGTSARWGLVALSATTPGVFDDLLVQYA